MNVELNELDESMSFDDWRVNSNFQDHDNVNQLKVDNHNLRFRCYNLDNELNKCTCRVGGNKSVESLIEKNASLLKDNEKMKEKLAYLPKYELQISEIESMKYLNKLFNEKAPMNELIQEMKQYNDNLIKSNVTAQHKVFNLELSLANVQQHKLTDEKMLAKSQDLNSEIETQQEVIAGIQCRLTESIQRTECAESHLAQTIKGVGEYETNVCNLQSANMKLSDQIKELCAATNRLTVENSRLTSDVEDISTSLLKMTRSVETMTEEKELIANKVTNLYKKVLPTLKNDDDDIMINDIGGMLEYLEKQLCNAPPRANSSSWATSEKNYYESGLEYRNNLEQKIGDNIFSDVNILQYLTNVTSLNTDKMMAEGARNTPDTMTGFKISTIEDEEDPKRRLKVSNKEDLKRAIDAAYTSQMCQSLIKKFDILKTESAINNENVVKVVKRKSKK